MPCQAQFDHQCSGPSEPAHSDSLMFGRGHGHKSPDWAFAAVCHQAHLDFDLLPRHVKEAEWLRAYIATCNYLWVEGKVRVA